MRTARFLLVLASLAALLCFAAPAWADTITVPRDYGTIQWAINAAEPGDTVWVAEGVYDEIIAVDKAITLCGAGSDRTIIDGGSRGMVIDVIADGVTLRDLGVRNSPAGPPYAAINMNVVDDCLVERCACSASWAGIRFTASMRNTVRGCTFADVAYGVDLGDTGSSDNTLVDCQATDCTTAAYNAYAGSNGLRILRCSATSCATGVQIGWSSGWIVECSTITLCETGIVLDAATSGIVRHNTVTDIVMNGMWIAGPGSSGNDIHANLFARCLDAGVALQGAATGNAVHDNRLEDCGLGVHILFHPTSPNQGNTFVRNCFRFNDLQAQDESGFPNAFHDAYPLGNYWDDSTGADDFSGPDQDIPGSDGVFDAPYVLGAVFDRYPATTADTTGPSTSITSGPSGWIDSRDVDFAWTGGDDRTPTDCLAYSYSLDDEASTFDTVTGVSFEGLAEGEHTLWVRARDAMGNEDWWGDSAGFGVDVTPPHTEDDGDTAWHKTDTTVHFTPYDELSGIDYTEYSLDGGGSWTPGGEVTIPAPPDGSGDGDYTVLYRSVDVAGNVEETRSCVVRILAAGFAFDHEGAPVGSAGDRVNDVVTVDLDGDGDLDVVSAGGSAADAELVAWENDGSPFVGDWPHVGVGGSPDSMHSVRAADLDNDGDVDLVSGSGDTPSSLIFAWQNDGTPFDGGWTQHLVGVVGSEVSCQAQVALSDFDGDGWTDIASATSAYGGSGQVLVWPNLHAPWDGPWSYVPVFASGSIGSVATADFNGDRWADLAVSHNEGSVTVLLNPGPPLGPPWSLLNAGWGGPGMVSDIAPADFNFDGFADFATSIGFLSSWAQWVWANPMGPSWPQVFYADVAATSVAVGDLDDDGLVDLFGGNHGSWPEVMAYDHQPPPLVGGFARYVVADLAAAVRTVALGDFDGDGDLDAVSGGDVSPEGELLAWENLHTVDEWDPWSWTTYDWDWKNTSVDLDLQADDVGSGVHHIEYKVGERGEWKVAPPAVFTLGKRGWGGGQYVVYHRAVDNAGNVESPGWVVVAVDGKPPVTSDDADDEWHSEDVYVELDARDELSGVRQTRYSIDGGTWQSASWFVIAALEDHSNDGVHEVRYYSVDWAGNHEQIKRCLVRIDTTAPLLPLAKAAREKASAAAGGRVLRARSTARLQVDLVAADLASRRVAVVVRVRDAHGRVLDRVKLARVEVGRLTTLRFTGDTALGAASVRITVRDQAGFARTRTLRL